VRRVAELPFIPARALEREREREIGNLLPNNRRQRRTCYALCHLLYPESAAQTSIFRMDSNSTSYRALEREREIFIDNLLVRVHSIIEMS